jgi:hypothetical protein
MAMYSQLEEIVIYDYRLARKELVVFYLETFTELRVLELNCENDFDSKCLDKLLKRGNLQNIERIFYGSNYNKKLAILD